ncbi:MAG: peptide chain release factor N(5)-glutamine methyltransferase [Candidatus Moranbacteria bacterium]|jgi:release factor glutamine methyltransferase|nr:peptide chain release factor N(5)-glutamine methyltransferase [Candidatus Moranbacteria bacterium]
MRIKNIADIQKEYLQKVDSLDLELIIAHTIEKSREFVLAHPEYSLNNEQRSMINKLADRRLKHEPIAYILGHKEFFGLDFSVNKHTLIPRPETEQLVELAIQESTNENQELRIIDVGTGSGCIIISIAKNNEQGTMNNVKFYATDASEEALKIAKRNALAHNVNKKIKFLQGNLLTPLIGNWKLEIGNSRIIILANLPYLSKEIYTSTSLDVKNFEPKSALFSAHSGLAHYEELFAQIKKLLTENCQLSVILEFSPEQKSLLEKIIPEYFSKAEIKFNKDLCGLWRICEIEIMTTIIAEATI